MRSTTIVHRSSAPQIPTPRPDLGRSGCSIWPRFRCHDFAFHGIGRADSTWPSAAWRKGVAHQKIRQAGVDREIRGPSSPSLGSWAMVAGRSWVSGRCAVMRRGTYVDGSSDAWAIGTVGRRPRYGQRGSPIPEPASVRDNVPRRSPVIWPVHPRSRSSVGERPPHTRKVAGSIPAGTTRNPATKQVRQPSCHASDLIRP